MTTGATASSEPHPAAYLGGAAAAAAGVVAILFVRALGTSNWESARAAVLFSALTVGGGFVLSRLTALDDVVIRRIILWGAAGKMAAAAVRYLVAFDIYDGVADASGYAAWGTVLGAQFRHLDFSVPFSVADTGFIRVVTGLVFSVTGPTRLGGFFVFAAFGFVGQYLGYRALAIARPDANLRRYAALVFLLPSIVYWPSSIGKETWMMMGIGSVAYGFARLLARRRGGVALVIVGLASLSIVRPHMALMFGVALLVAAYVRRSASPRDSVNRAQGSLVLLLAIGAVAVLTAQSSSFFDVTNFSGNNLTAILDGVAQSTSIGGSKFEAASPSRPWLYPQAVFSVLYRPLPFEARNPQMFLAALEGSLLLLLTWRWRHDVRRGLRATRRDPYLAFCATYAGLFLLAFSSFGNFGILARQRSLLFPLLLVISCAGTSTHRRDERGGSATRVAALAHPRREAA